MAEKLRAVEEAVAHVRAVEDDLTAARARLREALLTAHEAGASYALLGRIAGLSRERISQIVRGR